MLKTTVICHSQLQIYRYDKLVTRWFTGLLKTKDHGAITLVIKWVRGSTSFFLLKRNLLSIPSAEAPLKKDDTYMF